MKSFQLITPLLLTIFIAACNSSANEKMIYKTNEAPTAQASGYELAESDAKNKSSEPSEKLDKKAENFTTINKQKIIKDGTIAIKSTEITLSKKNLDEVLKKLNAYYETEELLNDDQQITYNLKLRIPALNFENFVLALENGSDEIINKNIQALDVTSEYTDIELRLSNKRAYLERYKVLLSKAASVKDILEIEENIRVLQEEIESKEGELKFLNDQVTYSTLNINLFQTKAYIYKPQQEDKFSERVKNALSSGWKSVVDFVLIIIIIWPWLIILPIAIYAIRRLLRKTK